jgi:hypothetical protein
MDYKIITKDNTNSAKLSHSLRKSFWSIGNIIAGSGKNFAMVPMNFVGWNKLA